MKTLVRFAGPVLAVLATVTLPARAEAGRVVFWVGRPRICTPAYRPVVVRPVRVHPAVAPREARIFDHGYNVGYRDGFRNGAARAAVRSPVVYRVPVRRWTYAAPCRTVRVIRSAPCYSSRSFRFSIRW